MCQGPADVIFSLALLKFLDFALVFSRVMSTHHFWSRKPNKVSQFRILKISLEPSIPGNAGVKIRLTKKGINHVKTVGVRLLNEQISQLSGYSTQFVISQPGIEGFVNLNNVRVLQYNPPQVGWKDVFLLLLYFLFWLPLLVYFLFFLPTILCFFLQEIYH